MGLMDNFKGAVNQAQSAGVGAVSGPGSPDTAQIEYSQRAIKLYSEGLPCIATINSIALSGEMDAGGAKEYLIKVHVEDNGEPYDAVLNQYLTDVALPSYQPGTRFEAKADPSDRSSLLLYGLA